MAETKVLKGINFPGLEGTYYVPEAIAVEDENGYIEIKSYVSDTVEIENLDTTLTKEGMAADAKAVGDAIAAIENGSGIQGATGADGVGITSITITEVQAMAYKTYRMTFGMSDGSTKTVDFSAPDNSDVLDSMVEIAEVTTQSINLNDGVYEYGRFAAAGTEYDKDKPIESSFRNANYIPVEGGRTIAVYYDAYEWNHNNRGWGSQLVQYDADKNILVERTSIGTYASNKAGFTLNADTAYVRLCVNCNGKAITTPLDEIKMALYYIEDAVMSFVEYGGITSETYMVRRDKVNGLEPLRGKKIVYDGDSIAESRSNNGGGYAKIIADYTGGMYTNQAVGGARLCANSEKHSVVNNLTNLPTDGDLYCFEGGINDFWANTAIGECSMSDYTGTVDATTICGALETIFRYALTNFVGKPICFVITHKIENTAYRENSNGNSFKDYRDAMVKVCEKYSIPYYDAFHESGLNGWNDAQSNAYLTASSAGTADGIHPNADGYNRYYVPQLLTLFRSAMPVE